jgi:hypothetical protein
LFVVVHRLTDEVWLRQQAPGGWRKHPLAVEALSRYVLSPDCCDLLDGLLEMDEVGGVVWEGGGRWVCKSERSSQLSGVLNKPAPIKQC